MTRLGSGYRTVTAEGVGRKWTDGERSASVVCLVMTEGDGGMAGGAAMEGAAGAVCGAVGREVFRRPAACGRLPSLEPGMLAGVLDHRWITEGRASTAHRATGAR